MIEDVGLSASELQRVEWGWSIGSKQAHRLEREKRKQQGFRDHRNMIAQSMGRTLASNTFTYSGGGRTVNSSLIKIAFPRNLSGV